jgi:hypothetical protein
MGGQEFHTKAYRLRREESGTLPLFSFTTKSTKETKNSGFCDFEPSFSGPKPRIPLRNIRATNWWAERTPTKPLLSWVILRSSDEESAFDFSVLIERIGKIAKQMLHFVQHDTTENSERLEGFLFLGGLCAFAPVTPICLRLRQARSFVAITIR